MVNAAGKRRVKSQYFEQQVQSKSTAIQMTRAKGRASDDVLTRAAARGCRGRRDVADGLSMRTDSGDVSACQAAALQGSKSVGNSIGKRLKKHRNVPGAKARWPRCTTKRVRWRRDALDGFRWTKGSEAVHSVIG